MAGRNLKKELKRIRRAVWGYDPKQVTEYIERLLQTCEKEKEDAVREIFLSKMRLAMKYASLKSQLAAQEKAYAELAAQMDHIVESMEKWEDKSGK